MLRVFKTHSDPEHLNFSGASGSVVGKASHQGLLDLLAKTFGPFTGNRGKLNGSAMHAEL